MPLDQKTWPSPVAAPPADGEAADPATVLLPGVARGDERLRAVVAAAAAFPDRSGATADGALFAPDPAEDRRGRAANVAAWLRRAAGDKAGADVLLDHLADTGRPLGDGLRRVALRDPRRLPDWAGALTAFLRTLPLTGPATAGPGALTAAFRRAAAALLPYGPAGILGVPVADAARADLAQTLAGRLTEAVNLSLCHELQAVTGRPRATDWDGDGALDASREGWLARLERLPALAYLVGITTLQWQRVTTEMFARLAADRELLVDRMWQGAEPGALTGVHGDAGDRHAGSRAVALLRFEHGQGVAYKPKDMRHGTAYMELVGRLNASGLPLDLPVRTILVRSDRGDDGHAASLAGDCATEYGWEELVAHAPAAGRDGFARFYRRLGMTVRLMQLLEGRDMWADNLLAVGEHPVVTDLECLLYPRVQTPPSMPAGEHGLLDRLESTVVRTAMAFQAWTPAKDRPALDIGCLSRIGSLELAPGVPALPLPPYRPVLADGVPADPWEFTAEVVRGYRDMHRALYRMRDELASPDGPLASFRGIWVRYIWRPTWDGYKIIRASTSPLALDDGATRETVIAGALLGAVGARAGDPERGDLLEVVLAELDAYRTLDIPFFRSLTTSSSVFTSDGREISGHFQGTGWQRLQTRIAELADFDLDAHTAVLTGCLDAARGGAEAPVAVAVAATAGGAPAAPAAGARSAGARSAAAPGPGELLEHAVAIGDRILADRERTPAGGGWIGQSWYPGSGLRQVEVLGLDLVSGTPGIALLLTELWSATGEPRFRQAARQTLVSAAALIDPADPRAFLFAADSRLAAGAPVPGGFAGPGALIHALARAALPLDEPGFITAARALVPGALAVAGPSAARPGRPARTPLPDTALGSAGLLLNLLRLRRAAGPGHEATDAGVRTLAAAAAALLADDAPAPESTGFMDLAPTGRDAVAAALARTLADAPGLLADPEAVRALLAGHRFGTGSRSGRLACLDSAVSLGAGAIDPADLDALVPPVTSAAIAALGSRALVAAAGEALTAADAGLLHTLPADSDALLPGPFYDGREAAGLLAGEMLARYRATGAWYPGRAAADRVNLGALDGLSAVGLLLLRLLDPAAAPLATLR